MDISAVVGDHYRLMMKMPEFSSNNAGKFSLVEPEKHIRYRWEWNHDGEVTEIDVSFFAIDGTTRIEIFHRSFIHQ